MKDALIKLLKVKSIITIVLTFVFAYLAIKEVISGADFLTVFTVVIGFYFGTQAEKKASDNNEEV